MSISPHLQVALKEWASVCAALEQGRQIFILRKGGILDRGGLFELEERQFLLFPAYLHQKLELLKPSEHTAFEKRDVEPDQIVISSAAVVSDVVKVRSRAQVDALDVEHIWAPAQIDMRFNYRPASPLYVVLLRVHRLVKPVTIANTPVYGGCRSWVPLDEQIDVRGAVGVLADEEFRVKRDRVMQAMT